MDFVGLIGGVLVILQITECGFYGADRRCISYSSNNRVWILWGGQEGYELFFK
jgi:hypothetical protein